MGFFGYLYPLTLVLYVVGLGSATHVLLFLCQGEVVHLGNLLPFTLVLYGAGFGSATQTYPVAELFLFDLARGILWRFECLNSVCSVFEANLLPFGADYAAA